MDAENTVERTPGARGRVCVCGGGGEHVYVCVCVCVRVCACVFGGGGGGGGERLTNYFIYLLFPLASFPQTSELFIYFFIFCNASMHSGSTDKCEESECQPITVDAYM